METSNHTLPAERKRPAPPPPATISPSQESVPDNTHAPRSHVILDALPAGLVIDSTMKNFVRWNEPLRDGNHLEGQEATDVNRLSRTLATATTNANTPLRQPGTNSDKQAIDTVRHQVQILQQQQGEIKAMPDTRIQEVAPADESAVIQLLCEIQQQQIEMQAALQRQIQQFQADFLAALQQQHEQYEADSLDALQQQHEQYEAELLTTVQKQSQQQQSAQNSALERRELELLLTARAQDGEMSRDSKAHLESWMATGGALRERVSGLEE